MCEPRWKRSEGRHEPQPLEHTHPGSSHLPRSSLVSWGHNARSPAYPVPLYAQCTAMAFSVPRLTTLWPRQNCSSERPENWACESPATRMVPEHSGTVAASMFRFAALLQLRSHLPLRASERAALWTRVMIAVMNIELRTKNYTVRTDEPTPGTLALIGDSRASLSHIVGWVDHTGGRS